MQDVAPHIAGDTAARTWSPEADRFVEAVVQHIHSIYGDDPRWHHLLYRQVLRSSKKLYDEQRTAKRQTDTDSSSPSISDAVYEEQWRNKIDIALGYPPHPLSPLSRETDSRTTSAQTSIDWASDKGQEIRSRHVTKRMASYLESERHKTRRTASRSVPASAANFATAKPIPKSRAFSGATTSGTSRPSTSSSLQRASASTSFSQRSSLSSIFPPGTTCPGTRLKASPPRNVNPCGKIIPRQEEDENIDEATEDDVAFAPAHCPAQATHPVTADASKEEVFTKSDKHKNNAASTDELLPSDRDDHSMIPTSFPPLHSATTQTSRPSDTRSLSPGSRSSRFVEHIRPSSTVSQPPPQAILARLRPPKSYEPSLAIYIPPNAKTNLPLPGLVSNRILQLFHEWTTSQALYPDYPPAEWCQPDKRYRRLCVQCHVRLAPNSRATCFNKDCRLADGVLGADSQPPTSCIHCQKQGIPCLKAETVVTMATKDTVGTRLKLWLMPLPAEMRIGTDPGDVGFWMTRKHQGELEGNASRA